MYSIYMFLNNINKKIYIGKTINPHTRFNEHKNIANGSLAKAREFKTIHAAIKKHGIENFSFLILEELENEKDAYEAERVWICLFDSKNNGYNETHGGEGFLSGENNPQYGRVYSDLELKEMSIKRTGIQNGMFGKIHTSETRELIRKSRVDKYDGESNVRAKLTNEQAQNIRKQFSDGNISINQLSTSFNVRRSIIERILRNETYKVRGK